MHQDCPLCPTITPKQREAARQAVKEEQDREAIRAANTTRLAKIMVKAAKNQEDALGRIRRMFSGANYSEETARDWFREIDAMSRIAFILYRRSLRKAAESHRARVSAERRAGICATTTPAAIRRAEQEHYDDDE